jgi:hypothetical protein
MNSSQGQEKGHTSTAFGDHASPRAAENTAQTDAVLATAIAEPLATPVNVIVIPEEAVGVPVAVVETAQPSHRQNSNVLSRKRKPDPNNELSVAFGSVHKGSVPKGRNKKMSRSIEKPLPVSQCTANTECDKLSHTNELIRHDLEAKAYQLIRDHETARLADIQAECARAEGEVSAKGMKALPSDAEVIRYFPRMIGAFNQQSIPDLKAAIDSMLAPNCVYRTHVIRVPGQTHTRFTDKIVPGPQVFALYKSLLETFPDAYYKVECNRLLSSKDGAIKTIAGYFTFRGIRG